MSKNQINKYVWLVETLYKAKRITLKEINRKWSQTELSEGEDSVPLSISSKKSFGTPIFWKSSSQYGSARELPAS